MSTDTPDNPEITADQGEVEAQDAAHAVHDLPGETEALGVGGGAASWAHSARGSVRGEASRGVALGMVGVKGSPQASPGRGGAPADPDPGDDGSTAPAPRTVRFRPAGLALTVVGVLLVLPLVLFGAWALVMHSVATWHHTAHTEPVAPMVSLVSDGTVEVVVDPGATQVSVQADAWYAWDWQAPTYEATSSGGRLEIRHECGRFPISPSCEAGLTVVLPPDTQLDVQAGHGPVTASDLTGPVDVSSSDGRIELARIGGDVVAHSGNGRVEVSDVTGSATVTSNDGAVVVSRIGGDVVTARSGNGSVEVSDVRGSATVTSSDGSVAVNGVDGDVDARSGNGRVEVVSVAGAVTATSSDGAVLVEDVLGNIDARSGNGSVTVYGTGVPVALDISSSNGRQTVEAATDPAAAITVTINSSDGAVSYLAPRAPSQASSVVPDVVGQTQPDALAALEDAGLGAETIVEGSADVPEGLVLRTDPAASRRVARGTVVTVVVATSVGG